MRAAAPRPRRPSGSPAAACRTPPPSPPTPRSRCRRRFTARTPAAPSSPMPVSTTASRSCAQCFAADRNMRSTPTARTARSGCAARASRRPRRPRRSNSRWLPPGATRTTPSSTGSPSSASRARQAWPHRGARAKLAREARRHVLRDDEGAGGGARNCAEQLHAAPPGRPSTSRSRRREAGAAPGARARRAARAARSAVAHPVHAQLADRSAPCGSAPARSSRARASARGVGFATKSTAPSSSALKTSCVSPRPLTTITGVGSRAISRRRNVKPSMRGISRSSVIRSGRSSRSPCASASSPSGAQSTTSTSGERSSMRMIVRRLNAESSITSTRIAPLRLAHAPSSSSPAARIAARAAACHGSRGSRRPAAACDRPCRRAGGAARRRSRAGSATRQCPSSR